MEAEALKRDIAKYADTLPAHLRQGLYTIIIHTRSVSIQDGTISAAKTAHGVSVNETDKLTAYLIERESEAVQWLQPNPENKASAS